MLKKVPTKHLIDKNKSERIRKKPFQLLHVCLFFTLGLTLTACLIGSPTIPPTPLPTVTDVVPTPTFCYPTVPPSPSPIPQQSPIPTADHLSKLGAVIFQDDFSADRGWELKELEAGAISLLNERLVIAIRQSDSFLFSLYPNLSLRNFYLEVDVRADLCQDGDEYGVLFRANERFEHYRFSLNCQGESRVVRILRSDSRSLVPLSDFPFIKSGAMSTNRLSFLAVDDTFQFWINGFEVFTHRDIALAEGVIGLFVRSGRGNSATISFDNLLLQELLPSPTPSATNQPEENYG